jgi:hypothetical protein
MFGHNRGQRRNPRKARHLKRRSRLCREGYELIPAPAHFDMKGPECVCRMRPLRGDLSFITVFIIVAVST